MLDSEIKSLEAAHQQLESRRLRNKKPSRFIRIGDSWVRRDSITMATIRHDAAGALIDVQIGGRSVVIDEAEWSRVSEELGVEFRAGEGEPPWTPAAQPDSLEHMFALQAELNRRVGVDTDAMQGNEDEVAHWVLQYVRALQQESAELVDSIPWKWWAKYQKMDVQNARVEVVDMLHFLISLAQVLGMSAPDVYAAYLAKNKVNHGRQEKDGYASKDEDDSRHI